MEMDKNDSYIDEYVPGGATYFLYDILSYKTKIGMTSNKLKQRYRDFKIGNPHITLLFTINGLNQISVESYLHRHFKDKNYHGEWFSLDKDDFIYIINKYRNNIKRYKINNLLVELGVKEVNIKDFIYFAEPPKIKKQEPVKIIEVDKNEIEKETNNFACLKCNKLLKRNENIYCKWCNLDIIAEKKIKEQRLMFNRNIENMLTNN